MKVLDENIPESQRQLLRSWRIRVHQVGHEVARQGMKDERIIPFLHHLRRPTFFTRDSGFYDRRLCHANYCLVCLVVSQYEAASFIRRFLRHPEFKIWPKRKGKVIRVSHAGIRVWKLHGTGEEQLKWLA